MTAAEPHSNQDRAILHFTVGRCAFCVCVCAAITTAAAGWMYSLDEQPSDEAPALVAPSPPLSPQEQLKRFGLPDGFKIELVAAEPDVPKPINLSFDSRGRLYVSCSVGYPIRASIPEQANDKIAVLSDSDGDGTFDRRHTLVEQLNIPVGVTAVENGAMYYSIPEVYRWTGDVERPESGGTRQLYGTFGCQDTHGMVSSFTPWIDGWIYACHGFANVSHVGLADGRSITFRGGNTFRMRADGRGIEYVTHGQVNPFGLAFDPLGNLFSADSSTLPAYQLLRGAAYPSADGSGIDALGPGPAMMNHKHGSTCIAGLVYYAADAFPAEYRDTLFIGNPVTGRINHDRLEKHGTTMLAIEQPDFLTCSDPWFRPVDLKLGPDGALYVADFYNAVIGHVELPLTHPARDHKRGRIWRISAISENAASRRPPDIAGASSVKLVSLLGNPNLTVRVLATEELVSRGWYPEHDNLAPKDAPGDAWRRAHLLWLRERLAPGGLSKDVIERLAEDPSAFVRVHLLKALAERKDWGASSAKGTGNQVASLVRSRLSDADPFVRRAAADALGRHPEIANIKPLLDLWRATPADDTHLEHVVAMAVRDHFLFIPDLYKRLDASIISEPENERLLMRANLGAPGAVAVGRQIDFLRQGNVAPEDSRRFIEGLLPWVSQLELVELCRRLEGLSMNCPIGQQAEWLELLHRAALVRAIDLPDSTYQWCDRLVTSLFQSETEVDFNAASELAARYKLTTASASLLRLASQESRPSAVRAEALAAALAVDFKGALPLALEIIDDAEQALVLREAAVRAVGASNCEPAREELLRRLDIQPFRVGVEIAAQLAGDRRAALRLLAVVHRSPAFASLLQEPVVRERLNLTLPDRELVCLAPKVDSNRESNETPVEILIDRRRRAFAKDKYDAALGQSIFVKYCIQCHALHGRGGAVGPALDAIANRGIDRLLEDILAPSRTIAPEFRACLVALNDGRIIFGRLVHQDREGTTLADPEGKRIWFPADDIEEVAPSDVSVMPANLADAIAELDFNNLLAFLLNQRGN